MPYSRPNADPGLSMIVVDTPAAGFLLDLVHVFGPVFDGGLDSQALRSVALMAARHLEAQGSREAGALLDPSLCAGLIKRLRLTGQLACDADGRLALTARGRLQVRDRLAARDRNPAWQAALRQVRDELMLFSDYEGMSDLRFEASAGS